MSNTDERVSRSFVHTLSVPEHIWTEFFREFFTQQTLVVDDEGRSIPNNFVYEQSQIPENRRFDVLLEHDMKGANPDILPSLVMEDMGVTSLGVALNRLAEWEISPQTSKTRTDLIRGTYVIHCCSRDRGESRLLAAIVSNAITVFYDRLLLAGFHKLEPWSIGKTVSIKVDVDETYADTPVQQTFEYQQTWRTIETSPNELKTFCLAVNPDELVRYVNLSMDVTNPSSARYVMMSTNIENANAGAYVMASMNVVAANDTETYVHTSTNMINPLSETGFVRTSMRVA